MKYILTAMICYANGLNAQKYLMRYSYNTAAKLDTRILLK